MITPEHTTTPPIQSSRKRSIATAEAGPSDNNPTDHTTKRQCTTQLRTPWRGTNDDWDHKRNDTYTNRRILARKCIKAIVAADVANHHATPVTVDITDALTDNIRLHRDRKTEQPVLGISMHYLWQATTTLDRLKHDLIPARTSLRFGWPDKPRPTRNRCDDAEWMTLARSLGWHGITDTKGQQCHARHTYEEGTLRCDRCGAGPRGGRYRRSQVWVGECSCGGVFEESEEKEETEEKEGSEYKTRLCESAPSTGLLRPTLCPIRNGSDEDGSDEDGSYMSVESPNLLDTPNRRCVEVDEEEDEATQMMGDVEIEERHCL